MNRPFRSLMVFFGAALLSCGTLLPPRTAAACLNAVNAEDEAVSLLSRADDSLSNGKPGAAIQMTLQRFPDLKDRKGSNRLMMRAQRIAATAIARVDGLLAVRGFDASTAEERRANLEWSVATLRSISQESKNNPRVMTDLAEALSTLPEYQSEAAGILEDLARRDIMPTPYGYRALARLRRLYGDKEGAKDAFAREARLRRATSPDNAPNADEAAWGFDVGGSDSLRSTLH